MPSLPESLKKLIRRIQGRVGSLEDLIEILKKAHSDGIISSDLYAINERLFQIADKTVDEVMVPRVDMVAVSQDTPASEVIEIYKKWGFSKIPVYRKRLDDVVGILYIKELIKHLNEIETLNAGSLAIKPYFIPDSKKVIDTLREFQGRRISIALVVDEFGSVIGLVTLEDLLEEIVGEIWEEFDREEFLYRETEDGTIIFNTKIDLEEASRLLGKKLEAEDVHTLGGYILMKLDKVPRIGEKFVLDDVEFEVLEATQQRLKKVRAKVQEAPKEGEVQSAA